jgi:GTP cyclohydrolase II
MLGTARCLREVVRAQVGHPGRLPDRNSEQTGTHRASAFDIHSGWEDGAVPSRPTEARYPDQISHRDELPSGGRTSAYPREVARLLFPTPFGEFDLRAFESETGFIYLALVKGRIGGGDSVLTRVHSECLTGDALGSLRCDCGVQLRMGLRAIAAEGRGIVIYATGHEGRGIGLLNKLRAYVLQDNGADTVEANHTLGFPADVREYRDAARVLTLLGVRSVRLITNNPEKRRGLEAADVTVEAILPVPVAAHARNRRYLEAKRRRLGHLEAAASLPELPVADVPDVTELLGTVRDHGWRPHVIVKFAQTLDGRIATSTGDSKWISGATERTVSHALRAGCDALLVGVGTVLTDDPQLTVRLVPGSSPLRVVLDSRLRIPTSARVLEGDATTVVLTTGLAPNERRHTLLARGVAVRQVDEGPGGVDIPSGLRVLRGMGIRSLLVEGGSRVITSMLGADVVDRVIVGIAPAILGSGREAVGDLGSIRVADALRVGNRSVHVAGDDLLVAGDVLPVAARRTATG